MRSGVAHSRHNSTLEPHMQHEAPPLQTSLQQGPLQMLNKFRHTPVASCKIKVFICVYNLSVNYSNRTRTEKPAHVCESMCGCDSRTMVIRWTNGSRTE